MALLEAGAAIATIYTTIKQIHDEAQTMSPAAKTKALQNAQAIYDDTALGNKFIVNFGSDLLETSENYTDFLIKLYYWVFKRVDRDDLDFATVDFDLEQFNAEMAAIQTRLAQTNRYFIPEVTDYIRELGKILELCTQYVNDYIDYSLEDYIEYSAAILAQTQQLEERVDRFRQTASRDKDRISGVMLDIIKEFK